MNIKKLSDDVSVSPQINIEDCTEILKMGLRALFATDPMVSAKHSPHFLLLMNKLMSLVY